MTASRVVSWLQMLTNQLRGNFKDTEMKISKRLYGSMVSIRGVEGGSCGCDSSVTNNNAVHDTSQQHGM